MAVITVHFKVCVQNSQDAGTNDEHMVSRLIFDIEVDGKQKGEAYSDLKQTVGAPMAPDAIEVSEPKGYMGPWNQNRFADEARSYFLKCVGPEAAGIRIEPGAGVVMRDNVIAIDRSVKFNSAK